MELSYKHDGQHKNSLPDLVIEYLRGTVTTVILSLVIDTWNSSSDSEEKVVSLNAFESKLNFNNINLFIWRKSSTLTDNGNCMSTLQPVTQCMTTH